MKESNGNNDLKSFLIVNKSIDDLHDLIGTEYFYYIYYSILKIIKQIYMNMRGIKQMPGNNDKMLKDLLKESKLSDYEIKIIEEPGFAENYSKKSPKDLCEIIYQKVSAGAIKSMVVTMGSKGSIYADHLGNKGICPAKKVTVRDTTGAGDAFCAGLTIGLTYRKDLSDAVEIGTKLAASVITSSENVCPRFLPRELGLDMDVSDC